MSWDIFGNELRFGFCEAHPDVPEPWPCYIDREMSALEDERRRYDEDSATEARRIADIHADLALQHSIESISVSLPSDRDQRLARQEPFTVAGWDAGAA